MTFTPTEIDDENKCHSSQRETSALQSHRSKIYLEKFSDNGKLSIFDKHTLRQFKLPTYRAMGEKDFNNVHIDGGVLSFEQKFTHIEDQAAPIIAQIVQQKSLASLRPMDEAILHTFVVVQLLRSK